MSIPPTSNPAPGADGRHVTFCRICEAFCGLVATVSDGQVTAIEPDRDNPHSKGHVCVKGTAFHRVVHDPDRVLHPMRRNLVDGSFERVSWDDALQDIAARLAAIRDGHGPDALAFYLGNPSSFATDTMMSHGGFMKALGACKGYSPGSQDSNARVVANYALFGSALLNAFPDLPNCDFLLVFGANPLVSNGSILFAPRLRHDLDAIAARGRVVVVDPRRSETARRYEHLPMAPGGDVWLLLGLLRVLRDEQRIDVDAVGAHADGLQAWLDMLEAIDADVAAARARLDPEALRELARAFANAPRAAAYGRVGICRGRFATLTNALVTILNVVTGNFGGKRGGTIFGHRVLAGQERATPGGYGEGSSRIGDIPAVTRFLASAAMPDDILEPGPGQVRALMVTAGNPVLSAPGGDRLELALASLDLLVSFDFYRNETARFAHYILPTTTFLERPDVPYAGFNILMRPFLQATDAVLPPQGEARHEHAIWREIIVRMGLDWPSRDADADAPGMARVDAMLRNGPLGGDDGWSLDRLRQFPHGVMVDAPDPCTAWWDRLAHPDRRIQLAHPLIVDEFARLLRDREPAPDLALIGRRDIRSINSWMHNVEPLVRSQKPRLLLHVDDARRHGVEDGSLARLATRHGATEVEIGISEEVAPGTACYPHGWGHAGSWHRANAAPGKNINVLLGLGRDATELVSGTTLMDGIAVTLTPIAAAPSPSTTVTA